MKKVLIILVASLLLGFILAQINFINSFVTDQFGIGSLQITQLIILTVVLYYVIKQKE